MTNLSHALDTDTIVAQATPPGRGGVSVVRISGPLSLIIAENILGYQPTPRYAHYSPFKNQEGSQIDVGIAIYFPNPHSLLHHETSHHYVQV